MPKPTLWVVTAALLSLSSPASAYTIAFFGPDAFDPDPAVMNATLGLTDAVFESFGDARTIPELKETHTGEFFFDGTYDATGFEAYWAWEGTHALVLRPIDLTFSYPQGTTLFGVGLANDEDFDNSPFTFQINGTGTVFDMTTFPEWVFNNGRADGRNGYLRIEADRKSVV